jgi:ABC-type transport system involved in multi-copper enzyme maturation permease subunit
VLNGLELLGQVKVAPVNLGDWTLTAIGLFVLLTALVAVAYGTRVGVIARATTKEAIRQPLFVLLLVLSALILIVNTYVPFFTLGDDTKMLVECGLATLLISGAILAVWTAGTSITSEIEGKTAMTLLSKPIDRRQFVVGKYLGIVQAVMWLFTILTLLFVVLVFFKIGYDQREQSEEQTPLWKWTEQFGVQIPQPHPDRVHVIAKMLPGVALAFLQVCVLGAISVTVSTRVPMVMNLVICFAVFVIGNLTEVMVNSSVEGQANESVTFTARLISMVVPSLATFNVSSAVATGKPIPQLYLGLSFVYAASYIAAMLLLGFLLFEDRDLA